MVNLYLTRTSKDEIIKEYNLTRSILNSWSQYEQFGPFALNDNLFEMQKKVWKLQKEVNQQLKENAFFNNFFEFHKLIHLCHVIKNSFVPLFIPEGKPFYLSKTPFPNFKYKIPFIPNVRYFFDFGTEVCAKHVYRSI